MATAIVTTEIPVLLHNPTSLTHQFGHNNLGSLSVATLDQKMAFPLHSYLREMCMTYGAKFPLKDSCRIHGIDVFLPDFLYKTHGWRLRRYLNAICCCTTTSRRTASWQLAVTRRSKKMILSSVSR